MAGVPDGSSAAMPAGPGLLGSYKAWVKTHPSLVSNLDWLLYLGIWSPGRLSSSEASYEAYHAAVGLLSVWHNHILEEGTSAVQRSPCALYLDLLEQVETLMELRAIHMESRGKMSRYAPLVVLESTKAILKFMLWSRYMGHLYLRSPGHEDIDQFESEQGLQDITGALSRLRQRYTRLADCTNDASTDTAQATRSAAAWLVSQFRSLTGATGRGGGSDTEEPCTSGGCGRGSGLDTVSRETMGANLLWLGEVLHILRPVIYVVMLQRHGRRSWNPWLGSLGVDALSMYFQKRGKWHVQCGGEVAMARLQPLLGPGCGTGGPGPRPTSLLSLALMRSLSSQGWSPGESREISERRRRLLLYLLRSPAVDALVQGPLDALASRTARVPLLGPLLDYAAGTLSTCVAYYTYTAGSS
ncbi:hypothetical protein FOA52_013015 [Chlamydomonas sp. UWO 241]|nr:hypothetical protein FOA52_013015 [Chlamydomonas sp. UWO 241]